MSTIERPRPAALDDFVGSIMDCDGHEQTPINHWGDCFGSVVTDYADAIRQTTFQANEVRQRDDTEITASSVWKTKWAAAPGAFDLKRRVDVLDFIGVRRQMIFPGGMGLGAVVLLTLADQPGFLSMITGDRAAYARKLISAYNEWCIRTMQHGDRTRVVAVLMADTTDSLLVETKRLADQGVRAVWMPSAQLPGGRSPAHSDLDPIYDVIARNDITLCAHVGADLGFYRRSDWNEAAVFKGFKAGGEFSLDPWTLCSMARAAENFLMTMVIGGVFERHQQLRMCVAELGAEWIGPLSYRMDMWIDNSGLFNKKNTGWAMSLKPSEYIRRNVRVVPYYFEDIAGYIQKYGLEDVYCYGSDYPHVEGGFDPMGHFSANLIDAGMADTMLRKFFVDNGSWIMPD